MRSFGFALIVSLLSVSALGASTPRRVFVENFKNEGSRSHAWISIGLAVTLAERIEAVPGQQAFAESHRRSPLGEMDLSGGSYSDSDRLVISRYIGGTHVLRGSYVLQGKQLRLKARLIDARSGAVEKSTSGSGTLDRLHALEDRVVRDLIGETPGAHGKGEPGAVAFEAFARGLAAADDNPKAAVVFFDRAVSASPKFLLALVYAARTHMDVFSMTKAESYLDRAQAMVKTFPTSPIAVRVCRSYGNLLWNRRLLSKAEFRYITCRFLAQRARLHETEDARNVDYNIAMTQMDSYQWPRALESIQYYVKTVKDAGLGATHDAHGAHAALGGVHTASGNSALAQAAFKEARSVPVLAGIEHTPVYCRAIFEEGLMQASYGDLSRALLTLEEALTCLDRTKAELPLLEAAIRNEIGFMSLHRGKQDVALSRIREAEALLAARKLQSSPEYTRVLVALGSYFLMTDDPKQALVHFEHALILLRAAGREGTSAWIRVKGNVASGLEAQGNFRSAQTVREELRRHYVSAGMSRTDDILYVIIALARLAESMGDYGRSRVLADQAEAVVRHIGQAEYVIHAAVMRVRAQALLQLQDPSAEKALSASRQILVKAKMEKTVDFVHQLELESRLAMVRKETGPALERAREAQELVRILGGVDHTLGASVLLARAEAELSQSPASAQGFAEEASRALSGAHLGSTILYGRARHVLSLALDRGGKSAEAKTERVRACALGWKPACN